MNTVERFAIAATVRGIQDRQRAGRAPQPSEGEMRAWVEWTGQLAKERRRRWLTISWWIGATLVLVAAAGAALSLHRKPMKLGFVVGPEAQPGLENSWIRSRGDAPTPIHFSDGSSIDLGNDSRARVVRLSPTGANVTLETGHAHADLVALADDGWSLAAGPFTVRAAGAEFDLEWDAEAEVLTLAVTEGTVQVTGPLLANDQRVVKPQRLSVSLIERQASLSQGER